MKNEYSGSEGWGCVALLLGIFICLTIPFIFIGEGIPIALAVGILLGIALLLVLISYAASEYEGARERVERRKEAREQERARYMMPLQAAVRSTNSKLQATAFSAVREYGYTQAALEQVYQDYTFDQLLAAEPERDSSSIDLEKSD